MIENVYTVKIINMDDKPHRFLVSASGIEGLTINGNDTIEAPAGEIVELPLRLVADPAFLKQTSTEIEFSVSSQTGNLEASSESRFLGPRTM